jgi:hypothetical protein
MTSVMQEAKTDFRDQWGFPSEVRASIQGAGYYDCQKVPGTYKSGRQRYECTFMDQSRKKVVARRDAMSLVSKKTNKPYFVCMWHEKKLDIKDIPLV